MKITSKNLKQTSKFAKKFLQNLVPAKSGATVVALSGNLGSAKTTFTKEVASHLGIKKKEITSPTFVIMKIFEIHHSLFSHLIHIDAYRIRNSKEILHLGWREIISNPKNLVLLEWPERIKKILPRQTQWVYFKFIDKNIREIRIKNDE